MQATLTKFLGVKERGGKVVEREETEESDFESDCEDEDEAETGTEFEEDEPLPVDVSQTSSYLTHFPSCWSHKVWLSKKEQYPWLTCSNLKLGCIICKEISSLGVHTKKNIHLSRQWKLTEGELLHVNEGSVK